MCLVDYSVTLGNLQLCSSYDICAVTGMQSSGQVEVDLVRVVLSRKRGIEGRADNFAGSSRDSKVRC